MNDLRPYYRDLAIGETIRFDGEDRRLHTVSVEELRGPRAVIRVDDETVELAIGRHMAPRDTPAQQDLARYVRRGSLQVGIDISRDFAGTNPYETSMIALSADARLYVGPIVSFSHSRYRFPIPRYDWNYDDNWLSRAPYGYHLGIDLYAPRGSQVVSVCDGVVQDVRQFDPQTDREDLWGRLVAIRGTDGFVYTYGHCDTLAPHVEVGATIHRGNSIGSVGKAGFESTDTPAHLHFEMIACGYPERFRFTFEPHPPEQPSAIRLLPAEAEGFVINPYPYLREWFAAENA
jgi:murein DD-endopeptidase MepM/ murein hydrolase activator NlpD